VGLTDGGAGRSRLYHDPLDAVAARRAGDRPARCEPRVKERGRDRHGWPTRPRTKLKRKMAKGANKN
jgi:hypothetical protein